MDEYIKRKDAIRAVCFGCNQQYSDEPCEPSDCAIRQAINNAPTADVVPKSEVAREIFEELYKSVVSKIPPHIRPIFKDDMDFEDGFRNGKTDALLEVLMIITELKKKYTEDQT